MAEQGTNPVLSWDGPWRFSRPSIAFSSVIPYVVARVLAHVITGAGVGPLAREAANGAVFVVAAFVALRWVLYRGPVWIDPFERTVRWRRRFGLGSVGVWAFDEVTCARLDSSWLRRASRDTVQLRIGRRRLNFEMPWGIGTAMVAALQSQSGGERAAGPSCSAPRLEAGPVQFQLRGRTWVYPWVFAAGFIFVGWLLRDARFGVVDVVAGGTVVVLIGAVWRSGLRSPEGTLTVDLPGETIGWQRLRAAIDGRDSYVPSVYGFQDVRVRTRRRGSGQLVVFRAGGKHLRIRTSREMADAICARVAPERQKRLA